MCVCVCTYMQLCVLSCFRLTLCDPMHCSPPAPLFMGIRQAGILEWLPMPPSGVFPTQGSELRLFSPVLAGGFFTTSAAWEALSICKASSDNLFAFLFLGVVFDHCLLYSVMSLRPWFLRHSIRSNPLNLFVTVYVEGI